MGLPYSELNEGLKFMMIHKERLIEDMVFGKITH